VQWAVKTTAKSVGITKDVNAQSTSYLCRTHLLEDGMDITLKTFWATKPELRWNIT
jgi:hypothetical protein